MIKRNGDTRQLEEALLKGYEFQKILLKARRVVADTVGAVILNELDEAIFYFDSSLAELEFILGSGSALDDGIKVCDGYVSMLVEAEKNPVAYLNDSAMGMLKESISFANEARCHLGSIVDGYKSI